MKLRRDSNPKVTELRGLPVFSGLGQQQLELLASNLDEARVAKGEGIIHEGHYNDTFWILLEGQAELTIGGRVHETLGPGDITGLPSMFTGRTALASVIARTDLRALVASHAQFNALLADREVEIRFKAAVFDRLRDEIYQLTHREPSAHKKPPTKKA